MLFPLILQSPNAGKIKFQSFESHLKLRFSPNL
nr:MAG TPA: hypothetical protein [Caudoviricetes sp.]